MNRRYTPVWRQAEPYRMTAKEALRDLAGLVGYLIAILVGLATVYSLCVLLLLGGGR